jgi:hypothetical protein
MPQAIAIAILSNFSFATVAGAIKAVKFLAAVIKFIAITASSMAASKLLAPKAPSFSDSSLSQRSQMVRSPIAARTIVYGRCRASGTVVYMSTTGSKNEYLNIVIALAGHEIQEIEEVYFNDDLVGLSGNAATGFYSGVANVYKHLGSTTQAADSFLVNETSTLTDGKWTTAHTLYGIAYLYVRLTWDTEKFPSGIPNISAVIKGKKVLDTRTSTTAYSANPALCLRDYLTDSAVGMGMDATEIDVTAINAAANICDEDVEVKPITVPATYENRYECNGVIATSASPDENIGKLLSAMGGLIAYSGGKVVPYAGGYRIPTVTLTEKHFVGPLNIQTRTSARDRVNSVKGVYVSESNGWQVSDFPTISSATYVTNDNNTRYYRDVVLPFTTSSSCAQRLAVIELRRAREEITFTARFRLEAMQVRAGDTVMITNAKLGWSSKVFEVMEWHFATDGNPPQLYIDMTLRETDVEVYSWDVDEQIYVADSPNTTLPDPFTLDAPSSLALTADGTTQFIQADGTAIPRIKVKWTPPAEEFIQSGGAVVIEYKPSTSTTYLTWSRVEGAQTEDYISSDVKIGTNYNVRIFGESYFKISTSYVTSSVTVAPDTTPPATPTGLTAIAGTGQIISLDWDDNTEPDFGEYGVWRNTSNDSGGATKIAETRASRFVDVNLTLGTTYYYWISAYDRSENQSAKSTGASATAVAVTAGQTDNTPPVDPSAPTVNTTGTYLSGDGTTLARIVVNVPAFTTRCVIMNVLYRKSGTAGWIVADQRSTGGSTSSIDDLTPNVSYEIAVQAFSAFGIASNIVSGGTQTAPNNSTAPATPSGSGLSKIGVTPKLIESTREYYFGTRASWTPNTETDFDHYEIKAVSTNNSSDTSYTWFGEAGGSNSLVLTKANTMCLYAATPSTGFTFLRAVNRSGVASAWVYVGLAADNAFLGAGTVSAQDKSDVSVSGIKTGTTSASSVRQVQAVFQASHVVALGGGSPSPTETFSVDISNRGFSTKPDVGVGGCASDANLIAAYDFDNASNSSSTAYVRAATLDGSNIGTGNYRFNLDFTEYN